LEDPYSGVINEALIRRALEGRDIFKLSRAYFCIAREGPSESRNVVLTMLKSRLTSLGQAGCPRVNDEAITRILGSNHFSTTPNTRLADLFATLSRVVVDDNLRLKERLLRAAFWHLARDHRKRPVIFYEYDQVFTRAAAADDLMLGAISGSQLLWWSRKDPAKASSILRRIGDVCYSALNVRNYSAALYGCIAMSNHVAMHADDTSNHTITLVGLVKTASSIADTSHAAAIIRILRHRLARDSPERVAAAEAYTELREARRRTRGVGIAQERTNGIRTLNERLAADAAEDSSNMSEP
jgi:hypothetical protein